MFVINKELMKNIIFNMILACTDYGNVKIIYLRAVPGPLPSLWCFSGNI